MWTLVNRNTGAATPSFNRRIYVPDQAPELTLILPRDLYGILGHQTVQVTPAAGYSNGTRAAGDGAGGGVEGGAASRGAARGVQRGISISSVLEAVYAHYQGELGYEEQVAAMEADPRVRRMIQVGTST